MDEVLLANWPEVGVGGNYNTRDVGFDLVLSGPAVWLNGPNKRHIVIFFVARCLKLSNCAKVDFSYGVKDGGRVCPVPDTSVPNGRFARFHFYKLVVRVCVDGACREVLPEYEDYFFVYPVDLRLVVEGLARDRFLNVYFYFDRDFDRRIPPSGVDAPPSFYDWFGNAFLRGHFGGDVVDEKYNACAENVSYGDARAGLFVDYLDYFHKPVIRMVFNFYMRWRCVQVAGCEPVSVHFRDNHAKANFPVTTPFSRVRDTVERDGVIADHVGAMVTRYGVPANVVVNGEGVGNEVGRLRERYFAVGNVKDVGTGSVYVSRAAVNYVTGLDVFGRCLFEIVGTALIRNSGRVLVFEGRTIFAFAGRYFADFVDGNVWFSCAQFVREATRLGDEFVVDVRVPVRDVAYYVGDYANRWSVDDVLKGPLEDERGSFAVPEGCFSDFLRVNGGTVVGLVPVGAKEEGDHRVRCEGDEVECVPGVAGRVRGTDDPGDRAFDCVGIALSLILSQGTRYAWSFRT